MNRVVDISAKSAFRMLLGVVAAAGLVGPVVANTSEGNSEIEQAFLDQTQVAATQLKNPAFDGVFGSEIYDVELGVPSDGSQSSSGLTFRVFQADGALHRISTPTTTMDMGSIKLLVDPAFRMDRDSAAQFGRGLRAVMPDGFFDYGEIDVEPVQDHGEAWYFLTGDFFDDYKGFVVSVDGEGRVTDVAYDLKLMPKE